MNEPLIAIFKGKVRGLDIGKGSKKPAFVKLYTRMRRYMKFFKPTEWYVFTIIMLHMDENGWAWPDIERLEEETGMERKAIYRAIKGLDAKTVKDQRVMIHFQPRSNNRGHFGRSCYLLFPDKDELELHNQGLLEPPPYYHIGNSVERNTVRRASARRSTVQRNAHLRNSVPGQSHHVHEQEPCLFKNHGGQEAGSVEAASLKIKSPLLEPAGASASNNDDLVREVLAFYTELTGNAHTREDEDFARKHVDISACAWKVAVASGLARHLASDRIAGGPHTIKALSYFEGNLNELRESNFAGVGPEYLSHCISHLRKLKR